MTPFVLPHIAVLSLRCRDMICTSDPMGEQSPVHVTFSISTSEVPSEAIPERVDENIPFVPLYRN